MPSAQAKVVRGARGQPTEGGGTAPMAGGLGRQTPGLKLRQMTIG